MALKRGSVEAQQAPKFDIDQEAGDPPAPTVAAEPVVIQGTVVKDDDSVPFTPAEPAPAVSQPSQAVAHRETRTGIAQAQAPGKMQAALADDGMEGLDFGFGAFPVISLGTDGTFSSTEAVELGTEFSCVLFQSRRKFICKNGLPDNDPNTDFFYSYYSPNENSDLPQVTVSGKPLDAILTEWKTKGWVPEWKPYLDVVVQMVDGHYDGQMCLLSIPKTSISRFSGFIATQKLQKGVRQNEYVTKVTVGKKITSGAFPFRPWSFAFDSMAVEG